MIVHCKKYVPSPKLCAQRLAKTSNNFGFTLVQYVLSCTISTRPYNFLLSDTEDLIAKPTCRTIVGRFYENICKALHNALKLNLSGKPIHGQPPSTGQFSLRQLVGPVVIWTVAGWPDQWHPVAATGFSCLTTNSCPEPQPQYP